LEAPWSNYSNGTRTSIEKINSLKNLEYIMAYKILRQIKVSLQNTSSMKFINKNKII
jgi:hypothetical protein